MEIEPLKKIGLSDKEIQVYLTLLRAGPATAGMLSHIAKLHRTHAYDLLDSLTKKGFVSFVIKERKKYFQCSPPERFLALFQEKHEEWKQGEKGLTSLVSQLQSLASISEERLIAGVYSGLDGFKTILSDILATGKDYLLIGHTQNSIHAHKGALAVFQRKRIEQKIRRKMLVSQKLKDHTTSRLPFQEVKYLPANYHIPMSIIICGKKVALVVVDKDYKCISIENERINNNFRKFFELLWQVCENPLTRANLTKTFK